MASVMASKCSINLFKNTTKIIQTRNRNKIIRQGITQQLYKHANTTNNNRLLKHRGTQNKKRLNKAQVSEMNRYGNKQANNGNKGKQELSTGSEQRWSYYWEIQGVLLNISPRFLAPPSSIL